jgi:predicted molibdopterin-dependent oxidoreductase YjgC
VQATEAVPAPPATKVAQGEGLRLLTYRPLFSGAAVERTPELAFMRPDGEIELAGADARSRGIRNGDPVTVASNGQVVSLRARIAHDLPAGSVRIPRDTAAGLHEFVEVSR